MEPTPKRRKLSASALNAKGNADTTDTGDPTSITRKTKSLPTTPTAQHDLPTPPGSQPAPPLPQLTSLPNELQQLIFHHCISTPPLSSPDERRDVATTASLIRVSSLVQANVVAAVKVRGDPGMRVHLRVLVYDFVAEEGRRKGWSWGRSMREGVKRVRGLGMD